MPRFSPFGYSRNIVSITVPFIGFLNGTSQANIVLSKLLPHACELERLEFVTTVLGTGASAAKQINVRNGNATGTACGALNLTLANQGVLGVVLAGTVTTAANANKFGAADSLTVEVQAAGASAFTAGGGEVLLTFRDKNQGPA